MIQTVSDKAFNIALLLQRAIFALAYIFFATGATLHLNAFIQNGIDIGLPYAAPLCTATVILIFICCVLILAGLATKTASVLMTVATLFCGFFFFAGDFNKVNITGVLFALVILAGFIVMGPGKLSLDYYLYKKRTLNNKRLTFR